MDWLRRLLLRLFGGDRSGAPSGQDRAGRRVRRVEDYLELLDRHPGVRATQIRILGGHASDDGVGFLHEHIQTEDDEGNARQVDLYEVRLCSFGHVLDQQTHATSICQISGCAAVLCSAPGCHAVCCACGASCCSTHRKTYQVGGGRSVIYCVPCSYQHYMKLWWGIEE